MYLRETFSALRHRNYRLFFGAQAISLVGTWMHGAAMSWLLYSITDSKMMLGSINALGMLPMLLLTPFAGVMADHLPRQRIVLTAQLLSMVFVIILASVVAANMVLVWHLAVFALCMGVLRAVDIPARHAMVIHLVDRRDLRNAVALNSSMFNLARMLGPAVAGILMARLGIASCFYINGLSFLPVILVLSTLRLQDGTNTRNDIRYAGIRDSLKGPVRFLTENPQLIVLLVMMSVFVISVGSYVILMPVFARDVFQLSESGYGYMLSINGVGALAGALTVAALSRRVRMLPMMVAGILLSSLAILLFTYTATLFLATVFIALAATGLILFLSNGNAAFQTYAPDHLRGRLMSLWVWMLGGAMPLGSLYMGVASEQFGAHFALRLGVAVTVVALVIAYAILRRLRDSGSISGV